MSEKKTAIDTYFEIVKSEYDIERNKKQSFESRAGIVLTMLGAVSIFLFDQVKLSEIIDLMYASFNFFVFIKIVSGIFVYLGFIFTLITVVRTIVIQKHNNFDVDLIDEELLIEERIISLTRIIFTYRDIILQHREVNLVRAKIFKRSLYGLVLTIIASIIYVTITA